MRGGNMMACGVFVCKRERDFTCESGTSPWKRDCLHLFMRIIYSQ